jgi:hypothetical protein
MSDLAADSAILARILDSTPIFTYLPESGQILNWNLGQDSRSKQIGAAKSQSTTDHERMFEKIAKADKKTQI